MDKETVLQRIQATGIVAVVRAETGDQAVRIAEACLEGGVSALEITFTVPGAHRVIEQLAQRYGTRELLVGAGTVLDPETARIALLSGAAYVVSPCFHPETVRLCNRYRVPCMPGIMSVRDAVEAMEAGADLLKLFPGEAFGPGMIKAIRGPLPQAKLMPTGGVDADNAGSWIKAGAAAVGAGGSLTGGAASGDYPAVTRTARRFVDNIRLAREELAAVAANSERKG